MRDEFFRAFFGLNPKSIKKTVGVSPIVYPKQFENIAGEKGKYYKSILGYHVANFRSLTFIKTPMTQSAVADLVLLLKKTKCQKIYFLGAIGGLGRGLRIGEVVVTDKAQRIFSVNSIHEETRQKLLAWRGQGILGIDFESRGFFRAAAKAKLFAAAYLVVTDLPLAKPFYLKRTKREREKIKSALNEVCGILWQNRSS